MKTIGEVFKVMNDGKQFEHLFDIAEEMKESEEVNIFKTPKFFSETRFANHARKVYVSFCEGFPALVCTLEGSSENQTKAKHASDLSNKIVYKRFAVMLCGLCDMKFLVMA